VKTQQLVSEHRIIRGLLPRILAVLLGVGMLVLSSACSAGRVETTDVRTVTETPYPLSPEPTPAGSDEPGPGGVMKADRIDVLVSELGVEGAEVEWGEEVHEPFFDVPGLILRVNGANIEVFEYPDVPSRAAVSDQISPDGFNLGTAMVDWAGQPNFWARDELLVLYVGNDQVLIDLLTKVLAGPITSYEAPVETETMPVTPEAELGEAGSAVAAARKALSEKPGMAGIQARLVSVVVVDWADACLELSRAEEMCAAVITPGYRVTLQVEDMVFEIHTDLLGDQVRVIE